MISREVEALASAKQIEASCLANEVAPGAVALQFPIGQALVGSTIVGVSKPEFVRQTLGWAIDRIDDNLWSDLEDLPFDTVDPETERIYVPG